MGLLGLSEHTRKGLWSRKSEYEYVNMTLTTLGSLIPRCSVNPASPEYITYSALNSHCFAWHPMIPMRNMDYLKLNR